MAMEGNGISPIVKQETKGVDSAYRMKSILCGKNKPCKMSDILRGKGKNGTASKRRS